MGDGVHPVTGEPLSVMRPLGRPEEEPPMPEPNPKAGREIQVLQPESEGAVAQAPALQPAPSLLGKEPEEILERATRVAAALAPVIEKQKLYALIQGKRHVLFEGWTTLGAMMGVFPITEWVAWNENRTSCESRVEARTLAGAIVGAAQAICSRDENRWAHADDYAIASMAQTRAGSKALRMPLGFIVQLAGYATTPADEMPRDEPRREDYRPPSGRDEETSSLDTHHPDWFKIKIGNGKMKGRTWKEMTEGSADGERHQWLDFCAHATEGVGKTTRERAAFALGFYMSKADGEFSVDGEPSHEG